MTKWCVAARIDERGKAVGGRAGDQSKTEVNVHTLAGTGAWTYILRPPKNANIIVEQAFAAAKNDNIGYDQNQRTTLHAQAKASKWNINNIETACECDCSSLVAVLCIIAGFNVSKDIYTGNQVAALVKAGFKKIAYNETKLEPGDIIWRRGHTEVYVGTSNTYVAPKKVASSSSKVVAKIVDLYHGDMVTDFAKIKKAGHHVILKVGPVNDKVDPAFAKRAKRCEELGIPYGVYFYSYAKTEAQARAEAKKAISWLKGRKLSYPVYFDSEQKGTQSSAGKCARAFCNEIERAGFWAGIYASESWWKSYLYPVVKDRYTKWVAKYGSDNGKAQTKPSTSRTDIWQYTSKGTLSGVSGKCDLNYAYRDLPKAVTGKSAKY